MLPTLILASTSRYRKELLSRLGLPFEIVSPAVDESALGNELPAQTALRLAEAKARAVARRNPQAVVIGCDQIAEVGGTRLNKPGIHEVAVEQLTLMSGKSVVFHSAMAVICESTGHLESDIIPTTVNMRPLTGEQIERYLHLEKPYDCAGSAKAEGLGISLISSIISPDPTALIGLPLIRLTDMLRRIGYELP